MKCIEMNKKTNKDVMLVNVRGHTHGGTIANIIRSVCKNDKRTYIQIAIICLTNYVFSTIYWFPFLEID